MPVLSARFLPFRKTPPVFWLVLAVIVIVAVALRLYKLDLIDFRFDAAYALYYAQQIASGIPVLAQPHGSIGTHPPVYLYLMAIPYLFTRDFMVVLVYHVMLDVATVVLCWFIGARYISQRVGLIAAALYAVSPWAIQYARSTWPVPQPLFAAVLLIGLIEIVQRKNAWGWALSGLGLALCAGTHVAAIAAVPAALIAFWIGRRTLRLWPAILGLAPLLIVAGVYLLSEVEAQFSSLRSYAANFGAPGEFNLDALNVALVMPGGMRLSDLTGKAYGAWIQQRPAALAALDTAAVVVMLFSAIVAACLCGAAIVRRFQRTARQPIPPDIVAVGIVLLWWTVPIALQLRHSHTTGMQYLSMLYPAPFLLMAIATDAALRIKPDHAAGRVIHRFACGSLLLLLAAIGVWQVDTTLRFANLVERYDTTGGFGLPVRSLLAARQEARAAVDSGQIPIHDVVLVVSGFPTRWHEQGVVMNVVMADTPHRFLNSDLAATILLTDGAQYIFAPGTGAFRDRLMAQLEPSSVVTRLTSLPQLAGDGYLYMHGRGSIELDTFRPAPAPPAVWESGVELAGYQVVTSERSLHIDLLMKVLKVDNTKPPPDYHWYNHVFVGETKLGQTDESGVHPASWRAGDFLLQSFDVSLDRPLTDPAAHVRIGSYTYPDMQPILVSEAGKRAENGMNLPVWVP